ncbi:MAG: hypothetical protein ABI051_00390 [Vicinamibacterales bacterium]
MDIGVLKGLVVFETSGATGPLAGLGVSLKNAKAQMDLLGGATVQTSRAITSGEQAIVSQTAKLQAFKARLDETHGQTVKVSSAMTELVSGLAAAGAVASGALVTGLFAAGGVAIHMASDLVAMSRASGIAASELDRIGRVGGEFRISLGQIDSALSSLQNKITHGSPDLKALGFDIDKLRDERPAAQLQQVAMAIDRIPPGAERAARMVALFGNTNLSPIVHQLATADASMGQWSDHTIENLARTDRAWENTKTFTLSAIGEILGGYADLSQRVSTLPGMLTLASDTLAAWRVGLKLGPMAMLASAVVKGQMTDEISRMPKAANFGRDVNLSSGPAPDAIARLAAAKIEINALTRSQVDQIAASLTLGEKLDDVAAKYGLSSDAAAIYKEVTKKTADNTRHLADVLRDLRDAQAGAVLKAQAWAAFAGSDPATLPLKVQQNYYHALQDVVDQFGSLKAAGLSSLDLVYTKLDALVGLQSDYALKIAESNQQLRYQQGSYAAAADETADYLMSVGRANAFMASVTTPNTVRPFGGVGNLTASPIGGLGKAPGKGFSESVFGMTSAQFGTGFSTTLMSAITGGGSVAKAGGAFIGQSIGQSVATQTGKALTGALGKTLGGAVSSILPGIGTLLGPLAGKVSDWMNDHLFGGIEAKANKLRDTLKEKLGGDASGQGLGDLVASFGNNQQIQSAYQRLLGGGNEKSVQRAATDLEAALEPVMKLRRPGRRWPA